MEAIETTTSSLPFFTTLPPGLTAQPTSEQEGPQTSFDDALMRLDRAIYAAFGRTSGGSAPTALTLAWLDWALHIACSPGKHYALATRVLAYWQWLAMSVSSNHHVNGDPRFDDPGWGR